jgi:transcriptional regulator with XRE-family HTH domain
MTISGRLKEERQRVGLSQTALASLAGASKSAVVSWEKGASAPTAPAISEMAAAGMDVLYILTGRRTNDRPDNAVNQIEDQIAGYRRNLLMPSRHRLPDEREEQTEERLQAILDFDAPFLTSELREEVEHLHDIATNKAALTLFRAADYAQMRSKRREKRAALSEWLSGGEYVPGDAVMNILTTLALEYDVPEKLIAELYHELNEDIAPHIGGDRQG